ncbi:transposable element Tcb1 transposase [Trichonephila clavipes]|nr:transposable element Tcb1 transposase [Trichonephila clavipes]
MMEAGWSARRVARQLGRSDCVWCHARRNWTAAEWNQVVFSDESRFNLSIDDNRVHVRRPRGERRNPAFALQRHTTPTAGVIVWGAIAYNTRSPLVLICGSMTAQRYVHDIVVFPPWENISRSISVSWRRRVNETRRKHCDKSIRNFITNLLSRLF